MKYCRDCDTMKPLEAFSKNKRKPDGLDIYCKPCTGRRSAENYQKNKAKRREQNKKWLVENPGKAAEYCAKWRRANPEKNAASLRNWYINNRSKALLGDKLRREQNLEKFIARERASYQRNKETRRLKNLRWRKANTHMITHYAAKRRASRVERTPKWLTAIHHGQIQAFYFCAQVVSKETGVLHHVDHIVPLRGKTVSGLHVPWNLQIIPAIENLRKNNTWRPA